MIKWYIHGDICSFSGADGGRRSIIDVVVWNTLAHPEAELFILLLSNLEDFMLLRCSLSYNVSFFVM